MIRMMCRMIVNGCMYAGVQLSYARRFELGRRFFHSFTQSDSCLHDLPQWRNSKILSGLRQHTVYQISWSELRLINTVSLFYLWLNNISNQIHIKWQYLHYCRVHAIVWLCMRICWSTTLYARRFDWCTVLFWWTWSWNYFCLCSFYCIDCEDTNEQNHIAKLERFAGDMNSTNMMGQWSFQFDLSLK